MKKVIGDPSMCWLCGKNGSADPLDRHHIFGGANRRLSEEDGLCVMLCHHCCHLFGPNAVHCNRDMSDRLKRQGQRYTMAVFGWTVDDFMRRYGKNYLDESALDIEMEDDEVC